MICPYTEDNTRLRAWQCRGDASPQRWPGPAGTSPTSRFSPAPRVSPAHRLGEPVDLGMDGAPDLVPLGGGCDPRLAAGARRVEGEPLLAAPTGGPGIQAAGGPAGGPMEPGPDGVPPPDRSPPPGQGEEGGLEGVLRVFRSEARFPPRVGPSRASDVRARAANPARGHAATNQGHATSGVSLAAPEGRPGAWTTKTQIVTPGRVRRADRSPDVASGSARTADPPPAVTRRGPILRCNPQPILIL
jgi:hypothetical protein